MPLLNKSLLCLNLCIELLSPNSRMNDQPYTPGPAFPPPKTEECPWCINFICACPMLCFGQLIRVGYYDETGWEPGPSQIHHHILGFREAETLQNQPFLQVSSETTSVGSFTGGHPSHAWIGANEDAGSGEV